MTGPPALSVRDVTFAYARRGSRDTALSGVSFDVAPGHRVALLGPNGSGKSTLFRLLCGAITPATGTIERFGVGATVADRSDLGVVFPTPALDKHLTVEENLVLHGTLFGLSRARVRDAIGPALDRAGIPEVRTARVSALSTGLARRVDLVRALLPGPRLLLLDEPTLGLDPPSRTAFVDEIDSRASDGLTVLMSTHLTDAAEHFDRVVLLHEGRVAADDTPGALRHAIGALLVSVADSTWRPPDDAWTLRGATWERAAPADANAVAQLVGSLAADGTPCSVTPPTLEHVFRHATGAALADAEAAP